MADPAPRLARTRRDARRFARDARRLAARHARRLGGARDAVVAAATEVDAAAREDDPQRLSSALRGLETLWDAHLARFVKPAWREYLESIVVAAVLALLVRAFVVDAFRIPSGSMTPTLLVGDCLFVSKTAYAVRIPFTSVRIAETGTPRRGDVIVFASPRDPGSDYVKRVVGVPGDVIELRDQVLYVNGVPQPRTPVGAFAYREPDPASGKDLRESCERYRESLARGALEPRPGELAVNAAARWEVGAASGVATYDVIQCRHGRPAAREGPFEIVQPGHVFVLGDNRDLSADSRGGGGWQVPVGRIRGRAELIFWSWGEGGIGSRGGKGLRLDRLFKRIR